MPSPGINVIVWGMRERATTHYNDAMDRAAIEWITDAVLASLGRGEAVDARALTFLLRRYRAGERDDVCGALEPALARALHEQTLAQTTIERAAWLKLFAEAASLSEDERLRGAVIDLAARLEEDRAHITAVGPGAAAVEACLACCGVLDPEAVVPAAIDELERLVGGSYRPGAGLSGVVSGPPGVPGSLLDHVQASSALLTAYECSGRLPYAMLAEELMQHARRTRWDDQVGMFVESSADDDVSFVLNCEAGRVLCRLGALHDDRGYRAAAVVAPDADYVRDAARVLEAQKTSYRDHGLASAAYGLALAEWFDLNVRHT
jgi:uncharacterized protein YyaL (SSP411 family)